MPPIGKNVKKSGIPTPDAPIVTLNDSTNILIASSPLGDSEIEMSINSASFVQYTGQINIGDIALPEGYYKFRIKKNTTRNSSSITKSPGATKGTNISLVTPIPPTVISDDINDTVYATHSLGASEIVISVNNGGFSQYNGATINVGNVNLASGYYRFKIKSATGRNESNVANSDAFTFTANTTPVAPTLSQDDIANTISASHPLGISEILVSSNNGAYTQYTGTIFVGNIDQPSGYWKFKTKAAPGRNESPVASSAPFTSTSQQNTTPVAPTIIADDTADTLSATHPLGTSEIIFSTNGGAFTQYNGSVINVGNVNLASGYYQFKTKAVTGRNESPVAISPAFTGSFTPARTYYISNSGNINNSGSPTSPWPISKLFQGSSFPDGTAFLFNRGETFVGRVVPYITNNVLYDAYGTGAKPIFTTMADFPNASVATNWTQQAGLTNVWTLIISPFTNYTPRVWLNGTEYQRAKLKTDVTATKRTCWENTDNQYFHVYSVGNPTSYYTSIQTASFTNNTMDVSGQNNCTIRNLDIRGSQGASLDCGFCSNLVIENCNIGRDGNREGVRVNTINGMIVRNNLFDTGERIMQDFNLSNEGGDGFLVGQGDTQNVEVYNNTFLNWRHAGILVEGDNANTILQNIHIYNNEASSPDIEYGRAVACYFYHSTNVVIENNNFHHLAIQNQFAATGLIFRNNIIENVRNNPYMDMGTGIGIAIGHSYFTPTNMQFLNNTIKDCYNSGIEMNGHLGNTGAYADVKDNIFQGNIFINNGWNVKNPFYDPTFSPLNCDIVIRDNLDVLNNSYINNIFSRANTDKCVYYGHDPVDSYLKTITEFGGMNGTAGDIITGNIIANSNTTPVAPTLQADDTANTLSASHVLGISEIVYSENGSGFIAYTGQINVGNVTRVIGYWQFKIKAATGRNESAVVSSPAFTVTNVTPAAPIVVGDDIANTLSASSSLGISEIVYSENGGVFIPYTGQINIGDVARAVGYWKFKIKAATGRNESAIVDSPAFTIAVQQTANTYTLTAPATTSAGVFKSDGTLIRTLWGNEKKNAGTYGIYWDGKDDKGNIAPTDNYHVELLRNNVQYNWEGIIGNTSKNQVGNDPDVMHILTGIKDMVIVGTKMYYTCGWYETTATTYIKSTTDIQAGGLPLRGNFNFTEISQYKATTDGNFIYWGGFDTQSQNRSWIWATRVSDNSEVIFPNGTPRRIAAFYNQQEPTNGNTLYASAIDYRDDSAIGTVVDGVNSYGANVPHGFTSMSVQTNGNYLFAVRGAQNLLSVINKTTGQTIRTLTMMGITAVGTDMVNGLWIATADTTTKIANSLKKYIVNSTDGTLTDAGINITSGLGRITYLKVSPDGNTMAAIDAGTKQQVKGFNNTTGAVSWIIGTERGYQLDASVTNTKFFFGNWPIVDDQGNERYAEQVYPYLAFQPDGKLWVGDIGNNRVLRFSATQQYEDRIEVQQAILTTQTHPADKTRAFTNSLEFKIDYTKTLDNGVNGSWKLSKNWMASLSPYYEHGYVFKVLQQLPNGRTYGTVINKITGNIELFELVEGGTLRNTGVTFREGKMQIRPNGDLIFAKDLGQGQPFTWKKIPLVGFDANNNPNWGVPMPISDGTITMVNILKDDLEPYDRTNSDIGAITATNKLASFNGDKSPGMHFGLIKLNSDGTPATKFIAKGAPSTRLNYSGDYPRDGYFDIGNGVLYPGGDLRVFNGNNILYNYHGEFWKGSQTNYFNHFYENGLPVGFFGKYNRESAVSIDAEMAGNVAQFGMVSYDIDTAYLYHGDEFQHSGMHRWSITGLSTIQVDIIPLSLPTAPVQLQGIDLMAGLNPTFDFKITNIGYDKDGSGYPSDAQIIITGGNPLIPAAATPIISGGRIAGVTLTNTGSHYKDYPTITATGGTGAQFNMGVTTEDNLVNGNGWIRQDANNIYINSDNRWVATIGERSYDKTKPTDLNIQFALPPDYSNYNGQQSSIPTQSKYITRDLTVDAEHNTVYNTTGATSWKLTGDISWSPNDPNNGANISNGGGQFMEVLDNNGKVITRIYPNRPSDAVVELMANNTPIFSGERLQTVRFIAIKKSLEITVDGTGATYKYGNYIPVHTTIVDPTANWQNPKTLRFYFWTWNDGGGRGVNFSKGRFIVTLP